MSTNTSDETDLEMEIKLAKIYYDGSYEKVQINKRRAWVYRSAVWGLVISYITFSVIFIKNIQEYYPEITTQKLMDYFIFVFIGAFAISILLSLILVRDRPWPYIYLHYNSKAVKAADEAGTPLIPPSPTHEETERSRQEYESYLAREGSLSMSDYILFGATVLIVCGLAFKQDVTALLGAMLILGTKFRLMFYGIARFGEWQGTLMFLGATAAILAVIVYGGDASLWEWFRYVL